MRRKQFLKEFLGALGAKKILWKEELETSVSGTVVYDIDNPEEVQNFVWHKSEAEAPTQEVTDLAELLAEKKLLSIDKIKVSRQELRRLLSEKLGRIVSESELLTTLEALESIEVPMVDEGVETDYYFIHE